MENSTSLRRALWANVVFAELGAIAAFFLNGALAVVDELTGGWNIVFGIELLVLAGLATYAVLKKKTSSTLVWLIITMNLLLVVYLGSRLVSSLSAMGTEVVILDMIALLVIVTLQVRGVRSSEQKTSLAS